MNKDFDKTPSFFNNEESFSKYLGNTSYYLGLQQNVKKLIELSNPQKVLELGSATGATSAMLANAFPYIQFTGVDMRSDVVSIANKVIRDNNLTNITFEVEDMIETAQKTIESDFILLLYSFHHLPDPIEIKIEFLKNMFANMKNGAYLCIAETFIPDSADGIDDRKSVMNLWSTRKNEGYYSTFWHTISGLDSDSISYAEKVAEYCGENEYLAGDLVAKRQDEYLIQPEWLIHTAKTIGYEVVVNQPINTLEDRIVLLRKD